MKSYFTYIALAASFAGGIFGSNLIDQAHSQTNKSNFVDVQRAAGGVAPGEFPSLEKTLWVIELTPAGDGTRQNQFLRQHLAHQMDLEKRGIMFAAGPTQEIDGKDHFGLIIIRANSDADAKKIADSDPMHINGARTYRLYRWSLNEGTIDLRVNFAKGNFELN